MFHHLTFSLCTSAVSHNSCITAFLMNICLFLCIYDYFPNFHNTFPAIEHSSEIANQALVLIVPFAQNLYYCCIYAPTILKSNLKMNILCFCSTCGRRRFSSTFDLLLVCNSTSACFYGKCDNG